MELILPFESTDTNLENLLEHQSEVEIESDSQAISRTNDQVPGTFDNGSESLDHFSQILQKYLIMFDISFFIGLWPSPFLDFLKISFYSNWLIGRAWTVQNKKEPSVSLKS